MEKIGASTTSTVFARAALSCMFLLFGLQLRAGVYVERPDATSEENEQLAGLPAAQAGGPISAVEFCNDVLNTHSTNCYARLVRARALLQVGRIHESEADLLFLRERFPAFPGTLEVLAELSLARGDKEAALGFYRERLLIPVKNPVIEEPLIHWTAKQILELEGRVHEVEERLLVPPLVGSRPYVFAIADDALGDFYLRNGKYDKATIAFESAIGIRRFSQDRSVDSSLKLGIAQWAKGDKADALRTFLSTSEAMLDDEDTAREDLAFGVLGALTLTHVGVGTEEEKKKATRFLRQTVDRFPDAIPFSQQDAVTALAGRVPWKETRKRVEEVLKRAPGVEWARWDALWLGLENPGQSGHLLKLLPADSIQRRIAEIEGKGGIP